MKQLNKEQREFLEYIRDNHHSLGWRCSISEMINSGFYDTDLWAHDNPTDVIHDFKKLLKGFDENKYGKPTKYLKG